MYGQYPRFKNSYFYEELTENFLLTPAELEFVRNCRGAPTGSAIRACPKRRAPKSRGSGDPSSLERWLKHPPSNA